MSKKVKCVRTRYFQSMSCDFSLTSPPKSHSPLLNLTLVRLNLLQRAALAHFHWVLNNVPASQLYPNQFIFFSFLLLDRSQSEVTCPVYSYLAIRHRSERSFVSLLGYSHSAQSSVGLLQPHSKYVWDKEIVFRTSEMIVSL